MDEADKTISDPNLTLQPKVRAERTVRSTSAFSHDVRTSRYVWYVVILLALVNLINYVDRMALAVLAPLIKADLHLSDSQLGLLTGFAFAVFYAICGIPIARWADRASRRDIIALALITWSAMTALTGASQHYLHLLCARIGVAAGEAGSWSPGAALICDYVPLKKRPSMLSVHSFGIYAGILTGMAVTGWLGVTVGWRWTFLVLGLPGLLLALVVRLTLREPKRGQLDAASNETILSFSQTMASLWRCHTYRFLVFWYVANGFVGYGFNQWWPSFYERTFDMNLSTIGVYLGVAFGGGAGAGVLLGGLLANWISLRDVRKPLFFGAGATGLSLPTAMGSLFVSSVELSISLLLLTSILWGVSIGPIVAAQTSVVPARVRSTAGGINIFFTSVLGFGLGPFVVGVLSDVFAPSLGSESLRYALLAPASVIPLMVLALIASGRALPNDLKDAGAAPFVAGAPSHVLRTTED